MSDMYASGMKRFLNWFVQKERIDKQDQRALFQEREIWYCSLGLNIGREQDGKGPNHTRPILIIKKFNKEIFWALPLSSTLKNSPYYFPIEFSDRKQSVILSQIKLCDAKRLSNKIGNLESSTFKQLIEKLKELLP